MPLDRGIELEQVYAAYLRSAGFWMTQFRISEEDYQDCLQESWIKASRCLPDYNEAKAGLRSWFHGILWHQVLDLKRKQSTARRAGRPEETSQPDDDAEPTWASGEFHLMREECQEAVEELRHQTELLLREHAPAHKTVFDGLLNDTALREIAIKLGRTEQSVGASVRRKRQEFVAELNSDTALGERLRRIKALAEEIAEFRRMLDDSLTPPQGPKSTEGFSGDDE